MYSKILFFLRAANTSGTVCTGWNIRDDDLSEIWLGTLRSVSPAFLWVTVKLDLISLLSEVSDPYFEILT